MITVVSEQNQKNLRFTHGTPIRQDPKFAEEEGV